jgi:hypothetical protein
MSDSTNPKLWDGGKCRVPMWSGGGPAGFCDAEAFGPQLPKRVLFETRSVRRPPHCYGPCCPNHGGPRKGEPILFIDGSTERGRPMWCAVMPDFVNLQESPIGFSGDPLKALANLLAEIGAQQ